MATRKNTKTSKKTVVSDEVKKERRERAKAKRAKKISLETARVTLLTEMANAVMSGELTKAEIVSLGETTRDKVKAIEAELDALTVRRSTAVPRGFVADRREGKDYFLAEIAGLNGNLVTGRVDVNANDAGLYRWTLHAAIDGSGHSASGASEDRKLALGMLKGAMNAAKRAMNKVDANS